MPTCWSSSFRAARSRSTPRLAPLPAGRCRRRSTRRSARSRAIRPATSASSSPRARASPSLHARQRGDLAVRPGRLRDHRRPRADGRRQLHRRQQDLRHQLGVDRRVLGDQPRRAAIRAVPRHVLRQGAIAQGVGTARGLGRPATAAEVGAFAAPANPAAFGAIAAGATAFANANQNNPAANPLAPLRALQFMPPFVNVPNAVEDGEISDSDFAYTIRLAYDVNDTINVYAELRDRLQGELDQPVARQPPDGGRPRRADRRRARGQQPDRRQPLRRPRGIARDRARRQGQLGRRLGQPRGVRPGDQRLPVEHLHRLGLRAANAGKQSTFGVEFEGVATVADALTLNFGVTWLDPEVRQLHGLGGRRPVRRAAGGHPRMDRGDRRAVRGRRSATA